MRQGNLTASTTNGAPGQIERRIARILCGAWRAGVSRGADLSCAVFRKKIRRGADYKSSGGAADCHFCLTAQLGLIRNLTAGEILAQVLLPLQEHKTQLAPQTNVVLMGQGEPLLNFEPVMAAVRILLDPEGMGISPKHVTLSTSGIVPGIERLAQERVRPKLAISLNASNDEQRDAWMPINNKYPLTTLMNACKEYPLRTWEHLTFEYVMLGGLNDAAEDARRVVRLLAPLKSVKVNLIPWNAGELAYREFSPERIEEFRRILVERGVPASVRYSRGRDVMAACGQLALLQIDGAPLSAVGPPTVSVYCRRTNHG